MQIGSFVVFVSRQSGVPTWLPFRKPGSDAALTKQFEEHSLRAEVAAKELSIDAGISTAPLSFHLPGGFGVAVQHSHKAAGGLRQRKQPLLYQNKKAAIFFQGYLSNLDELINELVSGSPIASSYGSSSSDSVLLSNTDQGQLAAQVVLEMYLRTGNESDKLAMLLSELQGEYAFVVYDSSKRQVFAARDPNGKEVLYVDHDADGGMAFSNTPSSASWDSAGHWQEVLPGHYYGGRNTKQAQQFALTPVQLRMREYAESMEDTTMLYGSMSLNPSKRGANSREFERDSPLSNQSSHDHAVPVDHLFRISI